MRELVVIALSEDGRHIELGPSADAKRPTHRIAVDDRLRSALRGYLPRPGHDEAPSVSLTPKEIQARLRAGESPEELAAAAEIPLERIERYAGPVLSERERVIEQARAATLVRARLGASTVPLGEAVDTHLAATVGLKDDTVEWTARRLEDGTWEVAVSFVARARGRSATWIWDPTTQDVTAVDTAGASLGHVEAPAPKAAPKVTPKPKAKKAPKPAKPAAPPKQRRSRDNHAAVPGWADVLLGATPSGRKGRRDAG